MAEWFDDNSDAVSTRLSELKKDASAQSFASQLRKDRQGTLQGMKQALASLSEAERAELLKGL